MPKIKTIYTCSFCGHQEQKWLGKCPDCQQWNTMYEEVKTSPVSRTVQQENHPVEIKKIELTSEDRILTGIKEVDRALGGGLVKGVTILIGGDPGIGKSTLVLQVLAGLARKAISVLYVSGEESLRQIRMRAERLNELPENLLVLSETNLESIIENINNHKPSAVVVDSVQTIFSSQLDSSPGSVSQIRETTAKLINMAKQSDTALLIIGHVTKEGAIAGPKLLEHMVDTVLYFEGDRSHAYRILRVVKNRFGSTDEIGVFEMDTTGLLEVENPSALFISERSKDSFGSAIVPSIEGTRPIMLEIQALVTATPLSIPRRTSIGIDYNRLAVLVAIVEKRLAVPLYNQDIFMSIAGGIRLNEPGADLGIIAAIFSSKLEKAIPPDTALCGEVGLTGDIRAVNSLVARINEAERLGFSKCILPYQNMKKIARKTDFKIELQAVKTVKDAMAAVFNQG